MADNTNFKHTSLVINNRKTVSVDGVINIEGFDDGSITVLINEGKLNIEGEGLKIESLSKDNGEIIITGQILGVYYSTNKTPKNFLAKIFG